MKFIENKYSILSEKEKLQIFEEVYGIPCTNGVENCYKEQINKIKRIEDRIIRTPISQIDTPLLKELEKLLQLQSQYLHEGGQAVMMGQFVYFPMSWLSITDSTGPMGQTYKNAPRNAFNTYKMFFRDQDKINEFFSNGGGTCNATVSNFIPHKTINNPDGIYNYVPIDNLKIQHNTHNNKQNNGDCPSGCRPN
jgi:hypothetical protein